MTIVAEHGLQNCARGGHQDLSSYKMVLEEVPGQDS